MDHYHAQIYLVSDEGDRLVLVAGAGKRGRNMVEQGHSIPVTADSVVARATRERDLVIVNDVTTQPEHVLDPDLPETQSELAVPIIYAGELLGVLDIQDDYRDAYTEVEVQVKRTLANQIAVAIQNARQFRANTDSLAGSAGKQRHCRFRARNQ